MQYQSIEAHLIAEFGFDQYQAYKHAQKHRQEVMQSEICGCFFCHVNFKPTTIRKWTDNEMTACCPECGLGGVIVGSASGMPIENKEFLALIGSHWL